MKNYKFVAITDGCTVESKLHTKFNRWRSSAELCVWLRVELYDWHVLMLTVAPSLILGWQDQHYTDKRQVATIKIWNPKTDKRKLPKLFCWNYFWKLFRKPKFHFQKKDYFHGIGL